VPDELIIMIKEERVSSLSITEEPDGYVKTKSASMDKVLKRFGVSKMERLCKGDKGRKNEKLSRKRNIKKDRIRNIYKLRLAKHSDIQEAIEEFEKNENVEYAEPNYIFHTAIIPIDNNFYEQWGLNNTGQTGGTPDADIDAPEAWEMETGSPDVVIAVIDCGVDWDHPDLAANIWINSGEIAGDGVDNDNNGYIDDYRGWDFVSVSSSSVYPGEDPGPRDNNPMDFLGHGTNCSGIIGAVSNNTTGIAGVAWNCRIMAVRAGYADTNGYGALAYADVAPAIIYAADNGAKIINMSFIGSASQTIKNAIDYAYSEGVTLIAAAGNSNTVSMQFPAAYDEVIAVSATDHNDDKAYFSNYGSWIDVAAPGVNVYTTAFNNTYSSYSGTSMAAPYVCGVAGLILSRNPLLTHDQVRQVLRFSADDIGTIGWDQYFGYGRVNAHVGLQIEDVCVGKIESPEHYANIKGTINIIGTASGVAFDHYEVYYGEGIEPTDWTQIGSGIYSQVINDVLVSWDTTNLPDTQYTIRLMVFDSDLNVFDDRKLVIIDNVNVSLSFPLQMSVLRLGDTIDFTGTINAEGFHNYAIEWRKGTSPTTWYTTGIILENGGLQEVTVGGIGSWDTTQLLEEDEHKFRVIVDYGTGLQHIQEYDIYFDSTIQVGWPKSYYNIGSNIVVDLDGDGDLEIVAHAVLMPGVRGAIYAWHHDGTAVAGWPTSYFSDRFASLSAGDVDNDGEIEVVLGYGWNANKVYLFESNGALIGNWPQTGESCYPYVGTPVLSDIDKDGDLEIFAGGGKFYAWHHNGMPVSGWPKDMDCSSPSIADINGDGESEIIVTSLNKLYVFDRFGNVITGWPITLENSTYYQPVVGDIDSDGSLEIVVVVTDALKVYMFDSNGVIKPGWPVSYSGDPSGFSAVIGDINNDGYLEVFLASGVQVNALDYTGNCLTNWPVILPEAYCIRQNASPVLGDVNGDGNIDLLIGAEIGGEDYERIYAYDASGTPLTGWPKPLRYIGGYGIMNSPTICDLDNDGNVNIVISSNADVLSKTDVYVWDLPFFYNENKIEWGMFGNDLWNTGAYGDHIPPITTADPPGGFYTSTVYVTLSYNESSTTYYTTDGSDPDGSSPIYTQPIEISSDVELRFFSIDNSGNKEGTKTEIYIIDLCPTDPGKTDPGVCGCGTPDLDTDGDGVADCADGCPNDPGKTEPGICGCGVSDVDTDGDGVADCVDGCPDGPDKTEPGICGCGTADTDTDDDGTPDCNDQCPNDPLKVSAGICGCGVSDADTDGDGLADCNDGCPIDPEKTELGICGCGIAETDTDGDGTPDCTDQCPNDPDKTEPGICGCGESDVDSDGDGVADCNDGCPSDPGKTEPGVCGCGIADTDTDGDDTPDCNDQCPNDADKTEPGICGCGVSDADTDGDGVADCVDGCPNDPICGCGTADTDTDGDGTLDCNDLCPTDPSKTAPGICGCGVSDADTDGDGVADCVDGCPDDQDKTEPGICGCGTADTDTDADGTPDCNDQCPNDPLKVSAGICGCGVSDIDNDGDGSFECEGDCNDGDPTIYPGATEICDGKDNDCDGEIDEGIDICEGDFNGDGKVDSLDSSVFMASFGKSQDDPAYNPDCDFNEDGIVSLADFVIFKADFGRIDCPSCQY